MTQYKLVIAEKPSVAKSIAAVLKATNRKDGYLEGGGFLVSWCVGHLVELADASTYAECYAKWALSDLPILPEHWKYVITPDTKKQFDTLKQLMARDDVTSLVCATDAGREGELIFRLVYEQAKCKKPVERLWISSMEDSAIREGFAHLRPSADYDSLYRAALCRARADWMVGINATRLFSCLYHRTLNIGRVMTPTLALIVQREADIDAFKPTPFYTVTLGLSDFAATGERLADKAQAEAVQAACMAADAAVIKSVERKEKTEKPPALYDLTTLQREANRLLGFTAQQTLDYLQSLYEKKLATYPRTDSRYLTSDMTGSLPVLVNAIAKAMPFVSGIAVRCNPAQVVNDAKVSDHHAIIPTQGVKDADLSGLPAGERSLLHLIAARLLCAVGQPYAYAETAVVVECAGYEFKAKGRAVLNPGFKELDGRYRDTLKNKPEPDKEKEAKALPVLAQGQSCEVVTAGIKEGKTTPPAHFTEDSLLAAMETAGAGEMPEDAERKGLGTPATRAGILEKLIKVGFLERKKVKKATHLMPTHAGVALITVLPEQIQSPSMTAEWEHQLKEIERGGAEPEAFLDGITAMLKDLIEHYEAVKDASVLFPSDKESLGKCPRCGGSVVELKKGFVCENRDCGFAIWKESKFFTAKKKKPTTAFVTELLASGRAKLSGCYSEKTGKTYLAQLEGNAVAAPDLSGQPVTRQGNTITIGDGPATHEIDITVSDEEWKQIQEVIPDTAPPARDPLAPAYQVGDTVYLDDKPFVIENIGTLDVQLRDPSLRYPVFRSESIERFERLLQYDLRNGPITEFFSADLEKADADLREVLTSGLLTDRDKMYISGWLRSGEGNTHIEKRLSDTLAGRTETMELITGETADYYASTTGIEVEIQDKYHSRRSMSWGEVVPVLRALYQQELDGFSHDPVRPEPAHLEGVPAYQVGDTVTLPLDDREISGTIGYIGDVDVRIDTGPYSWSHETMNREQFEEHLRRDERNAHLFRPAPAEHAQPEITTETETVYPGEKNGLPYDIVVERLHIEEPEPTPPTPTADNFRITDEHLGEGGPKQKFRANIMAIQLLKKCEEEHRQATPEEQKILSGYVGWGGLADAFDDSKASWATEYLELKTVLTPAEYDSARASTLNAHYTSPTVIKAIYEAVGKMGFTTGNILEPACGVGNFFGILPEEMSASRLYGVELDSISGRIAKQLYPKADITVAGFETIDRRDFYDLAIGNVPFGQYKVSDRAYDKLGFSIHDYFFAKALDQVRPGGVVAFVTSRYTMDKQSPEVRRYIAERAELLGAIRLPNNAFKANAGTDVVSDILFLQKRDRPIVIEPDWVHLGRNDDGFAINRYFVDHPEMILGRPSSESTQYGKQDFTVEPIEGLNLADQLHDAVKYIHGQYQEAELPELGEGEDIDTSIPADPNVKNYSYAVVDGEVYFRENSRMVKPDLNATAKERVKGLVELRECVQHLIELQLGDADAVSIRMEQNRLNHLYDTFTDQYGLINSRGNALAFADDSSYYLLCSLEVLDEEGRLERKADMFTKRTIKQHTAVTSVDTASEALAVSISEKARVDMAYMSQLTGKDEQTIADELRGVLFLDFDLGPGGYRSYQTADEFLSGNVRDKLLRYEMALEMLSPDDPLYDAASTNVDALKAAQPKDLDASEIDVRLGATWVDKSYIQQFMYELLDTPYYLRGSIQVNFSEFTAEWNITGKRAVSYNDVAAYTTYGTERANAYRILEDTLNLRDVRIYDTVEDPDGKERRVLNQKETTLAQQKQQAIKDAFRDWIWRDPERRQTLVQKYNEMFNATRLREYDGSHITFGGINPEIRLRPHQLNAIAHVLYGGNTLLAHEVGAGKTFEMVAAAMESKRLGLCQKSLFVVPNHLTEQWASEFLRLYPSANILVATKKDFETRNRKKFCSRIATGDYDAVIIGHSQFERIPVSAERQERLLQEQIWEIEEGLSELKASNAERFTIKQLEKTKKSLEARLDKLHKGERKDDVVTFEQLGVDRLFVDEAHSYKNLFLYTKMRNVAGISTTEAQKSSDMLLKCRYLDELTGGKGVVFATGTPVSNSMTELYTMMRYLQHDMLKRNHLTHFDNWASTFGETTTAIELAPEGTGYRARTRFAKFFNLPELMTIWKESADIKTADQLNLPTPEVVFHNEVAQPTEHQQAMVQELSERAAEVHSGKVEPWQDNMLKITSDGRKLGLDQRILNPMLPDDPSSKVNQCVENIAQIWRDGQADKLTQLVFCDISTPKAAPSKRVAKAAGGLDSPELRALELLTEPGDTERPFSVYEDIREKLIARGIPAEEIAFIHDANTEARKKELFAKVRSGQVRVLMGSTFKMGAGMNVQDRLIALHDLDCPWRPGDLEQRKGRIVRQGNQNATVHIYRYVTEGTFDSYLWQTVENKQKFISQIMTSKSPVRSCDDIDETALSYAEIKALCAGDPRIKEKMDLDIDVSRLKLLKANHQSQQYRLEDNLLKYFPEQIEQNKGYIAGFEKDLETLAAHQPPEGEFAGMFIRGDTLTDKDNAGAAILEACKEVKGTEATEIGSYRGFTMSLSFEGFHHQLTLKGEMSYKVELGPDARGNLTRIDNALAGMPDRLKAVHAQLDNLYQQQAAAKAELGKPFPQEAELQQKSARLAELNALLDMDGSKAAPQQVAKRLAKSERPSVLDKLKVSPVRGTPDKSHKKEMEVR